MVHKARHANARPGPNVEPPIQPIPGFAKPRPHTPPANNQARGGLDSTSGSPPFGCTAPFVFQYHAHVEQLLAYGIRF